MSNLNRALIIDVPSATSLNVAGAFTATSGTFTNLIASGIATTINTATDGATVTFNMNSASLHTVTLGGSRTLAVSNVSVGQKFIIRLKQGGSGSNTVTWFSGINWPSAVVPTLTTTLNKTDVFGFICTAANTYDGFVIGYNI